MKPLLACAVAFFSLLPSAIAQQAPWGRADVPISNRDRVYAADQTSNTVSVIDPSTNKLLGVIRLGDPVPGALGALYKGQLHYLTAGRGPALILLHGYTQTSRMWSPIIPLLAEKLLPTCRESVTQRFRRTVWT
jgi:YVTN family beta-propeller protein